MAERIRQDSSEIKLRGSLRTLYESEIADGNELECQFETTEGQIPYTVFLKRPFHCANVAVLVAADQCEYFVEDDPHYSREGYWICAAGQAVVAPLPPRAI